MDHLTEFLRARLDDDEQSARAALASRGGPRFLPARPSAHRGKEAEHSKQTIRRDPAHVLRQVEQTRSFLDQVDGAATPKMQLERQRAAAAPRTSDNLKILLKVLALSYDSHPDYREEWRS